VGAPQLISDVKQTVTFKRTATVDAKTGKVISYGSWDQASQSYPEVPSPQEAGYEPDQVTVPALTVKPDDQDQTVTVKYTAIPPKTIIVDPGKDNPVDANIKLDTVRTIKRTIKYVGAPQLISDVKQTVTFKRTATVDAKTGKVISYGSWDQASQSYPEVPSPTVMNYTAKPTVVPLALVGPDDKDSLETVTYTKDSGNSNPGSNGDTSTPTQPTTPTNPAQPATPSHPTQPVKPTPSQPAMPTGDHNNSNSGNKTPESNGAGNTSSSDNNKDHHKGKSESNKIRHSHKKLVDNKHYGNLKKVNRNNNQSSKITSLNQSVPAAVNNDLANPPKQANTLPQTGQDKHASAALIALGGLMLIGALGSAFLGHRKRD
ncbi:LPXTG cell wall anchor domain-containing protein, partial [Lactobacillus sp. XV13L]|nr:LPXTG cell wall anchor domain-containing protein [Lactobacillus sp. XV13L]